MAMYIPTIDKLPRWGSRVLTVSFPCFVATFISLFILVGLGSQLLGG